MFSIQEISLFQSDYFSYYKYENGIIEVQSKNTCHWWRVFKKDLPRATMIVVWHRYPCDKKYHIQCHVHTFIKAYKMIVDHDSYILKMLNE